MGQMGDRCACPYHDPACAVEATIDTARYGRLCQGCRDHLARAWEEQGLGAWMLDVKDEETVAFGRQTWQWRRKDAN